MSSPARVKYEIVCVDKVDITVDVSLLTKTDEMFFNATEIAKQFGKLPSGFLRLESTKEYITEVLSDNQYAIKHSEDLIRVTNGGSHKGTWLHRELAFEFAGWISPAFRRKLHLWAESRLAEEHTRQQRRLEAKTGFLPLTNAIQAAHSEIKPYHFSNECNMLNKLATGLSTKEIRALRGVENARDGMDALEIRTLDRLQRQNASLIELGFDYDHRKELLTKSVTSL